MKKLLTIIVAFAILVASPILVDYLILNGFEIWLIIMLLNSSIIVAYGVPVFIYAYTEIIRQELDVTFLLLFWKQYKLVLFIISLYVIYACFFKYYESDYTLLQFILFTALAHIGVALLTVMASSALLKLLQKKHQP
jgi:hypothetical protein